VTGWWFALDRALLGGPSTSPLRTSPFSQHLF
jgi:hypothetical protein